MADEVFALSPIAARPVQPSEQDYDAIKEAFMETSRGRWFLGEYAKRNRNADTKMVLDAVARIEDTLAAQKKPVRNPLLDEALTSFRKALAEARDAANAAVGDLALEQNLAPVRKGARVIREIAWRLREIGADGRICDLIDQQVAAIEGAAGKLSPSDLASTLSGAFDRIEGKIAAFDTDETEATPSPAAMNGAPAAEAPWTEAEAEIRVEEPAEGTATMQAWPAAAEAELDVKAAAAPTPAVADEPLPSEMSSSDSTSLETVSDPIDAFDANDEAMLDMVAMEMAAPDTDEAYEPKLEDAEIYERQIEDGQIANKIGERQVQESHAQASQAGDPRAHTPQAEKMQVSAPSWEIDVTFASDTSDVAEAPVVATALPAVTPLQPAPEPEPPSAPAPSLGSSLLANGIVPRPRSSAPDPLAPIRRMSQNEKIAFFS